MKNFFDSLAGYSFEDMQRKAKYDSDERAAGKANEDIEMPEDAAVEKTTVKVEGGMPEEKKEEVAEKIAEGSDDGSDDGSVSKLAEKSAKEEVMPAEEFDKLIGREPSGEEELDNDVEAVMDLVYKLPPEKAAKVLDRLNGLNLKKGEVPSDKNVKEGC